MKEFCNVSNKSAGRVVYNIKEDGIRRVFYSKETKKNIAVSELQKLVQQPGGLVLLYNYLQVDDPEIIQYLVNGDVAPEYWLTQEEIPNWMNTCSLDAFKDALDFAPEGTKDLIKQFAVSMPLNDYAKRQAIKDQLGFDVSVAIANQAQDTATATEETKTRRVATATSTETTTPQRRVVASTSTAE